jgi:ketosteroid isomerase-like protein
MTAQPRKATEEEQIRRVLDDWTGAFRAKDIERLWLHYAPDVPVFNLAPPLQHGAELRQELASWFETWRGPIRYEARDLAVSVGGDVAFSHSLNRMQGTRTDGARTELWMRATMCFRKIDGRWKIAHEHTSVPFYMDGSYRAAVDLVP